MIRIVHGVAHPKAVQHDRKLTRDCDNRAFLRILAAAARQHLPVTTQITVGSERSQDVLWSTDQEAATELITRLRDAQLRGGIATVVEPRNQTEVRTHIPTA